MPTRARALQCFGLVFAIGFVLAPIGDHTHVATGVTEYFSDFGPIWLGRSPLWFAIVVAATMATLAVAQGLIARAGAEPNRRPASLAWLVAAPPLVLGLYLLTSVYPWRDGGSLELIMVAAAAGLWWALDREWVGLAVGVGLAIGATFTEWALVQLGVFRYLPGSDELFGVAPALLPLYFAASVCVGALGRRMLVDA